MNAPVSADRFGDAVYRIERAIISIGRVYRVYTPERDLAAYVKHPLLKIREEFTLFADEAETAPLLKSKIRRLLQLNYCYDMTDPATGQVVATLQRRTLRSIFRDRMELLDPAGNPFGSVDEVGFAILRRFIKWLPRHWTVTINDQVVAKIDQRWTILRKKVDVDLRGNNGQVDPRVVLASALTLMHEVEGLVEAS